MFHATNTKETTHSSGTGTLTLDGAVAGFSSFSMMAYGKQVLYRIEFGAIYEIGLGTVQDNIYETGYELTRDIVLMSSAHGDGYIDGTVIDLTAAQINFPPGEKVVFAVSIDLSMVAQNIYTTPAPFVGYIAEATGSAAMAAGMGASSTALRSIAVGAQALALHENSSVIGNTRSYGPGFFARCAQRDGDPNGFPTWVGDTINSFIGFFSFCDTILFPNATTNIFSGKLTITIHDSTDGTYVGEAHWLVIDGATLVVTKALTQIYSTRAGPPALSIALVAPAGNPDETAVRASVSGGVNADRVIIRTEVFGTP